MFTAPSSRGESVTKATYWEIPSAGSPESLSGTVVFTVTVYLPDVVALPEIVPLFGSIVSPSGRPSAEYVAPFIESSLAPGFLILTSSYAETTNLLIFTVNESCANNWPLFPLASTLYSLAV